MTLYELYDMRIQHAVFEEMYGKGLWALLNRLLCRFWKHKQNNSAVGVLSQELAVTPRRRTK